MAQVELFNARPVGRAGVDVQEAIPPVTVGVRTVEVPSLRVKGEPPKVKLEGAVLETLMVTVAAVEPDALDPVMVYTAFELAVGVPVI